MSLTYRSSSPTKFEIIGTDPDGRRRVVTATKQPSDFAWQMRLDHPSGRHWEASFHGGNILDGMTELLASKDAEFVNDKARGDKRHEPAYDYSRSVANDLPPITPINRRS